MYIKDIPQLEKLSDRDILILLVQSVNEVKAELVCQNKRIRALETSRWILTGGLSIVAVLAMYIVNKLP